MRDWWDLCVHTVASGRVPPDTNHMDHDGAQLWFTCRTRQGVTPSYLPHVSIMRTDNPQQHGNTEEPTTTRTAPRGERAKVLMIIHKNMQKLY
jgi:hypothetical protein